MWDKLTPEEQQLDEEIRWLKRVYRVTIVRSYEESRPTHDIRLGRDQLVQEVKDAIRKIAGMVGKMFDQSKPRPTRVPRPLPSRPPRPPEEDEEIRRLREEPPQPIRDQSDDEKTEIDDRLNP
jgi:hypothetical protein